MINREDHVIQYVDAYLHGALDPADAAFVASHCDVCAICKVALDEAQKRSTLISTVPLIEASEKLIQSTERKINAYRNQTTPRRMLRWFSERTAVQKTWIVTAAVALLLFVSQIGVWTTSPSPFNLRVLGQAELLTDANASLRVLLQDHRNGNPVQGIPVRMELTGLANSPPVMLADFKTDVNGTASPQIHLPDWPDGDYTLRVIAQTSGGAQEISQSVKLQRSWKLMLSTDKPVYQPGQMIHVRSLALRRPDLRPVAGNDVQFTISDPKGNRIFQHRDVTSKFGIASVDCPLADEILEGLYKIDCSIGSVTSTRSVEIKKYALPKFKVDVTLDAPYYKPGDTIRGTVQAGYFFGKPVANAGVVVELQTVDVSPASPVKAEVRADVAGKAEFTLRVPESLVGRQQNSGDARIFLKTTVTDSAGQSESKSVSRIVTANPIRIEVIPEAGRLVQEVKNIVYLMTTYADGRPARARIAISGRDEEVTTDALGIATVELQPREAGVSWVLRATDDDGRIGRREIQLQCEVAQQDFLVRPDRSVVNAGETITLTALGSGQEPIFVDVLKDGQTILTDTIPMVDGKGSYHVELPAELFGPVELCAYRFGPEGLPLRKSRVLYIRPAAGLQIQTALDRAEYRPGESAKINVKLVDANGTPAPGAVSLSAVDEAVYSVLDQAPGSEQTFFSLEQQILQPVYAFYPWSPASRLHGNPEEQRRFEQALFSATAVRKTRDRESLIRELLPFVDNDRHIFDVLDKPDWEERLGPYEMQAMPESVLRLLRNEASQHSLAVTSYPENVRVAAARKKERQEFLNVLWIVLGVVAGVFLFVQIITEIFGQSGVAGCFVLLVVGGLLFMLTLPAVQQAREASRRSSDRNDLRQIEFAIANFQESNGKLPGQDAESSEPQSAVHIRQWFPETLLWRPELVTDNDGRASIDVNLADSITTWRVSASAVTSKGELGVSESSIRVFQPFFVDLNLPVSLTRGDEVAVPVIVYNYLDKPQTVKLSLEKQPWFELLEESDKSMELAPGEIRGTNYRLRVVRVGKHELQVTATAGDIADAIRREIEVVPDGRRIEKVVNGTLQQPQSIDLAIPPDAVDGSVKAIVRLYPSSFSELVGGLDAIFQMPSGCFEQTSSTTYPNVLALDYLRRTKKSVPDVEAKARQYIHLGYQRLLSFEIDGGGFDWFGHSPANRTLTAYGLMEFEDMARVHDVDPELIQRTRNWLLAQRQADGSWEPEAHQLHEDPTRGNRETARLSTTAYIAWALFGSGKDAEAAVPTARYLQSHRPEAIDDPYTLALVCNSLLAMNSSSSDSSARPWLDRLIALRKISSDGKQTWWQNSASSRTTFFGAGRSGDIEATALATLALLKSSHDAGTARGALTWLAAQKDGAGTWHSTQATVLTLKALLGGTGQSLGGDVERRIVLNVDDAFRKQIVIPADQGEVMQQIDLSSRVSAGAHRLSLSDQTGQATGFQTTFSYHVPSDASPLPSQQPLTISIDYDRTSLAVNDTVVATAQVVNNMQETAPMVILDLPIPAGFELRVSDLDDDVTFGDVAKFQMTPRSALIYLRALEPGKPLSLQYRLHATMPVKITVPAAIAYEYYDPAKKATSATTEMTVVAGS